eukprot:6193816-Pleurochrysis_carterae.AAC.4
MHSRQAVASGGKRRDRNQVQAKTDMLQHKQTRASSSGRTQAINEGGDALHRLRNAGTRSLHSVTCSSADDVAHVNVVTKKAHVCVSHGVAHCSSSGGGGADGHGGGGDREGGGGDDEGGGGGGLMGRGVGGSGGDGGADGGDRGASRIAAEDGSGTGGGRATDDGPNSHGMNCKQQPAQSQPNLSRDF